MSTAETSPQNVMVLVKYVPDAQFERQFDSENRLVREESILSELDENAIEAAVALSEAAGGDKVCPVTVVTMGPEGAKAALKKALQMGATRAVHVSDDQLAGSDALSTSRVLEAAIRTEDPDVVVFGMESTDAEMGVMPSLVAARLGWPQLTMLDSLELEAGRLRGRREGIGETLEVASGWPVVVSVTDQANEPRYPNFKSMLAARKKKTDTVTLADLGLSADWVGSSAASAVVTSAEPVPARKPGRVIVDDGAAGEALAEYLAENNLL